MKQYLCMDVGGSKYIVGLIDRAGRLVASRRGVWPALTQQAVQDTLLEESRALLAETGAQPDACGITIPGLADPARGMWVEASFSGIRDFAICDAVSAALGIPAYCENDGQAYAMAELVFGCCRDERNFLYVNISNGVGGSIFADGRLLYGARGNAGEIGHWVVVPGGRPCKCGSRGCLEAYCSGRGLRQTYAEAGGAPDADGKPAEAKCFAERARRGEPLAREVFEGQGRMLGSAIAKAINLLNPGKVVLGGGLSLAFDLFSPALKATVEEEVYNGANPDVEIVPTPLGYTAGLYGAAAIAVCRTEHLFN